MCKIKKLYVTHHSHTDIGYTDLQERVIDNQIDYIHKLLEIMKQEENKDFRWNCETLFCVEAFLETASEEEKKEFLSLARDKKVGISANYLNFTDLADVNIFEKRLSKWQEYFSNNKAAIKTAMIADINGMSMGMRDAMINCGVEFLLMNIHCHHGMYPLYQNQSAFWWENAFGQRLLVWNGEHYNLGNVLGLKPNKSMNFMMENHIDKNSIKDDPVETLHDNLINYLDLCEENGYEYDFILSSVSGVFSDNAPPETEILKLIKAYNKRYGDETEIIMVSLQELYETIKDRLKSAPVYRGDLTDWWANGVGSTPYAVKHYKEAIRRYELCQRLDKNLSEKYPVLCRTAEDNFLLYAEHTWGHSSTITNPCDTMVLNLDMRKQSYASKAHEAASKMLNALAKNRGDIMRYYETRGEIKVCNPTKLSGDRLVSFYIESHLIERAEIKRKDGKILSCQVSSHPRGRTISFIDHFEPFEEKYYSYRELPKPSETLNSRKCYVGSERVRDIVNTYDDFTYRLPYGIENKYFSLSYKIKEGVKALIDKRNGKNLIKEGSIPLFTPLRELTSLIEKGTNYPEERERRMLGRNIRGQQAKLSQGLLEEVSLMEHGDIFTQIKLKYTLPGTVKADVIVRLYENLPRIDFRLVLGKTLSSDIESIYLPLGLDIENSSLYIRKGREAFRPGIDQIPGTCMEYWMSDDGIAYISDKGSAIIASYDVPLIYMGEMKHHPIKLCDGKTENNRRPVYSWVMNNTWETNFKMDLSGFSEFSYSLLLTDDKDAETALNNLHEQGVEMYVNIVK